LLKAALREIFRAAFFEGYSPRVLPAAKCPELFLKANGWGTTVARAGL